MFETAVIFLVYITIPNNAPLSFSHPVRNLAECLFEAHQFSTKPSHTLLIKGGKMQVSCIVEFPKSEEH